MKDDEDIPTTPHELFVGSKPCIARFRVFGCPVIVRRWHTTHNSQGKQTERGNRGIFVGFDTTHKGYMVSGSPDHHFRRRHL
jgi:hypothetical protein